MRRFVNLKLISFVLFNLWAGAAAAGSAGHFKMSGQHAGMIGEYALGMGYEFKNRMNLDVFYGETRMAETQNVRQYTFKFAYSPFHLGQKSKTSWKPVYGGVLATYTDHPAYFTKLPATYPDNYYDQTAIKPGIMIGTEVGYRLPDKDQVSTYLEFVSLDYQLNAYVGNKGHQAFSDVFSAGVGLRRYF